MHIIVYRITGQQGIFRVPDWVCRECDLTVGAVSQAIQEAGLSDETILDVRPWLTHLGEAWRAGAHHPPAVLIDGALYSQEVVPDVKELRDRLIQDRHTSHDVIGRASE